MTARSDGRSLLFFPTSEQAPQRDRQSQKQTTGNPEEDVSMLSPNLWMLNWRPSACPPIEKAQIEGPREPQEKQEHHEPEH
jgi:hypothetical protein